MRSLYIFILNKDNIPEHAREFTVNLHGEQLTGYYITISPENDKNITFLFLISQCHGTRLGSPVTTSVNILTNLEFLCKNKIKFDQIFLGIHSKDWGISDKNGTRLGSPVTTGGNILTNLEFLCKNKIKFDQIFLGIHSKDWGISDKNCQKGDIFFPGELINNRDYDTITNQTFEYIQEIKTGYGTKNCQCNIKLFTHSCKNSKILNTLQKLQENNLIEVHNEFEQQQTPQLSQNKTVHEDLVYPDHCGFQQLEALFFEFRIHLGGLCLMSQSSAQKNQNEDIEKIIKILKMLWFGGQVSQSITERLSSNLSDSSSSEASILTNTFHKTQILKGIDVYLKTFFSEIEKREDPLEETLREMKASNYEDNIESIKKTIEKIEELIVEKRQEFEKP